jgi:hypothetical protein
VFDLEREVDAWSKKAYGGPCGGKAATLDELKDHIHCEVERLEAEGRTPEEAFRIATTKLGESAPRTNRICGGRALDRVRIGNSILWAAVMIATAIVLAGSGAQKNSKTFLLLVILVPAWCMSDQLLSRRLRTSGDG